MEKLRKEVDDIVSGVLTWYPKLFLEFLFLGRSSLMQYINPTRMSDPMTSKRNLATNCRG